MARIRIQEENRDITDHQEIREFLNHSVSRMKSGMSKAALVPKRQTKIFWTLTPRKLNGSRNKVGL